MRGLDWYVCIPLSQAAEAGISLLLCSRCLFPLPNAAPLTLCAAVPLQLSGWPDPGLNLWDDWASAVPGWMANSWISATQVMRTGKNSSDSSLWERKSLLNPMSVISGVQEIVLCKQMDGLDKSAAGLQKMSQNSARVLLNISLSLLTETTYISFTFQQGSLHI